MSWPLRAAGARLGAFPTQSLVQPDPQDVQPAQGSKYLFRVHVKLAHGICFYSFLLVLGAAS